MDSKPIAISLNNVSKVYKLYPSHKARLKEALHPRRKKYHKDFHALKDINLTIKKGETLGVLGMNGAGKSTLLKVISGVLQPSSGSVQINGNISALLELGSGFNPEFTGRENIYFYGAINGLNKDEMKAKEQEILDFADIGEFIDQPVKSYSSGMQARLAFSVASSIHPDILILDEVLSVGDMFFQAKCADRMRSMIDNDNTTVLFVSHNIGAIKAICNKCILMQGGGIAFYGNTDEVTEEYHNLSIQSRQRVLTQQLSEPELKNKLSNHSHDFINNNKAFLERAQYKRVQSGKAEFVNIALLDEKGNEINYVEYGQKVNLRMAVKFSEDIEKIGFGYQINDKNGVNVLYDGSGMNGVYLEKVQENTFYFINNKFNATLMQGEYNLLCVLSIPVDPANSIVDFCDKIPFALQFEVGRRKEAPLYGLVRLPTKVNVEKIS